MIPKDAPAEDWGLYYDNTYMVHKKLGPCLINVNAHPETGEYYLRGYKIKKDATIGNAVTVDCGDLRIMWPRPGAYNFPRFHQAAFIGRTPQRHMKRSAYSDHYYTLWSIQGMTQTHLMQQICMPAPHWALARFHDTKAEAGKYVTAALSSKVILSKYGGSDTVSLVYMGEQLGTLEDDKLISDMPHDSRIPRIRRHLATVGIK